MLKVISFAFTLLMCYIIAGYVYVWIVYLLNIFAYATTWIPLAICMWVAWKCFSIFRRRDHA